MRPGVFQGKIIVRPDAQKTDGADEVRRAAPVRRRQMNNKPELEIFADDVACGHGATCGALDEDLLFYLKARGLPQAEAESLLLQAFVGEAIEIVEHEGVREALIGVVEAWLRRAADAGRLARDRPTRRSLPFCASGLRRPRRSPSKASRGPLTRPSDEAGWTANHRRSRP